MKPLSRAALILVLCKLIATMFPEEMTRTVNYTITPGTYLRRPTP